MAATNVIKRKNRGPYKGYDVDENVFVPRRTKYRLRQRDNPSTPQLSPTSLRASGSEVQVHLECAPYTDDESDVVDEEGVPEHNENDSVYGSIENYCDSDIDMASVSSETESESDSIVSNNVNDNGDPVIHTCEKSDTTTLPLYTNSKLNLSASTVLIEAFAMRHSLSVQALSDLLKLIEIHCPKPNICKTSVGEFRRVFKNDSTINKCYYCAFCGLQHKLDQEENTMTCANCQHEIGKENHFLLMPIETQLKHLMSDGLTHILQYKMQQESQKGDCIIRDVTDGKLYQDIFAHGQHFTEVTSDQQDEVHISFQMNTDGVAVYKSSSQSAWPLFLTINELPPQLRFTRKYKILCGLWFGAHKPDMNIFLQPFIEELIQLYQTGLELMHGNKTVLLKAVLLTGVFDAPARCAIQNMVQFNGFYGCGTCYIQGKSVDNLKGTRTFVYKFDTSEENFKSGHPPLRSHQETLKHSDVAETNRKPHLGVKGISLLASAPQFDMIRGITIDYMHCVLLGVMKMLLNLWTHKDYKNMHWYVGDEMKELNRRLFSISPPNRITRLPRGLHDLANWKASELRSFLLYYSTPVLSGILPSEILKHFLLFVKAVYLLLQNKITQSEVQSAEAALVQFCMMFDVTYHQSLEKSNVHALLHLPLKVIDLGPLWAHSCFFYEDLNGDLRSLFHGTVNAAGQILNAVSTQQALPRLAENLQPGSCERLIYQNMTSHRRICSDMEYIVEDIHAVHPIIPCTVTKELRQLLFQHRTDRDCDFYKFERLLLHHQILHSKAYKAATRRNSHSVCFVSEQNDVFFGSIQYYLKLSSTTEHIYVAIIHKMHVLPTDVPHLHKVQQGHDVMIVPVSNIKELAIFLRGKDTDYVATFPNHMERE